MTDRENRSRVVWMAVLFEGALAFLAFGLAWITGRPLKDYLFWDWTDLFFGVAVSIPMLLGFILCIRWPVGPLLRIKQFSDDVIRPMFSACSIPDLAVISLLAGLGEELLFRGFLQRILGDWFDPWFCLALASVVFGVMHPITITYAVLASLVGFYLGWIWMVHGNLLV